MAWRMRRTCAESVETFMPSRTWVWQEIWSLGMPSISTAHMRQLPATLSPGW